MLVRVGVVQGSWGDMGAGGARARHARAPCTHMPRTLMQAASFHALPTPCGWCPLLVHVLALARGPAHQGGVCAGRAATPPTRAAADPAPHARGCLRVTMHCTRAAKTAMVSAVALAGMAHACVALHRCMHACTYKTRRPSATARAHTREQRVGVTWHRYTARRGAGTTRSRRRKRVGV